MPEWAETIGALIVGLVAAWLQYRGKQKALKQGEQAAQVIHAVIGGVEQIGSENVGAAQMAKRKIKEAAEGLGVEDDLSDRVKRITGKIRR